MSQAVKATHGAVLGTHAKHAKRAKHAKKAGEGLHATAAKAGKSGGATASGGNAGTLTTGYNAGILGGNQLVTSAQLPINISGNSVGILGWGSGASA
jgi:hypothetical protein